MLNGSMNAKGPSPQGVTPQQHNHCWHRTNITFTTDPPFHQEQCCHCGETQSVMAQRPGKPPGHGSYYPRG